MLDKLRVIDEIKELYINNNIENIDIAPELLEYLELKDLENLKIKVLNSLTTLTKEDKEWLSKFKKD